MSRPRKARPRQKHQVNLDLVVRDITRVEACLPARTASRCPDALQCHSCRIVNRSVPAHRENPSFCPITLRPFLVDEYSGVALLACPSTIGEILKRIALIKKRPAPSCAHDVEASSR